MKTTEIYKEFKELAKILKAEVCIMQADGLCCIGFAILKKSSEHAEIYQLYIYDKCLKPVETYPIRTFNSYREARIAFEAIRYNSLPIVELPF